MIKNIMERLKDLYWSHQQSYCGPLKMCVYRMFINRYEKKKSHLLSIQHSGIVSKFGLDSILIDDDYPNGSQPDHSHLNEHPTRNWQS